MTFLVLWSIYRSSSRVHFKNDPGYLTRERTKVFIPLMSCLLLNLVSRNFLVRQRYAFFMFFLSSPLLWWCPLQIFPSSCMISFLRAFWFFLFSSSIPLVIWLFPPVIICIFRVSDYFSLFSNGLMSSRYIWWLIFSYRPLYILRVGNWVASLLLRIVIGIAYFLGRCLSESLPQVKFSLLQSVLLTSFSWLPEVYDFVGCLLHF